MHAFRKVGLVALSLALSGTTGCSKSRSHDQADDDDDDPAPAVNPSPGTVQAATMWTFDSSSIGQAPAGFSFGRTGSGRPGRWVVRAAADAPSGPNVLAQEDSDRTDYRFPVAVADGPTFGDVSVTVRCKPVSGRVDRACGIVWRYQDDNNYYLTRANALEDNVCWYYVQNGRRVEVKRVHVPARTRSPISVSANQRRALPRASVPWSRCCGTPRRCTSRCGPTTATCGRCARANCDVTRTCRVTTMCSC